MGEEVPSPLDDPRFPDAPALSVWNVNGKRYVGPPESFGSPLVHERGKAWPVETKRDGEPIGVQLVRGAAGVADNRWTLVVDGVQCPYAPIEVDESTPEAERPVDGVPTCILPPPFSTSYKLTEDTKVRPLALSVRCEEEALAPAKVEVIVEQIIFSGERVTGVSGTPDRGGAATASEAVCRGEDPDEALRNSELCEITVLSRVELPMHRPRDSVAPSATMPYPVAAPSQSAIAVASYREVEKWKEREANIKRHNQEAQAEYKKQQDKYEERYKKHRAKVSQPAADGVGVLDRDIWTERPPAPPTVKRNDKEVSEPTRIFVIGGREDSAALAWSHVMKELLNVCCLTASSPKTDGLTDAEKWYRNEGASLYTHLQVMRKVLGQNGSTTALAVFEALLSGDTSPMAVAEIAQKYTVDDEGAVSSAIWDDSEAGRRTRLQKWARGVVGGGRGVANLANSSQFVWEYMPFEMRLNTHTRTRVVFEITEYAGGPPKRIALEPLRYDGYAAHAAYAELPKDVRLAQEATDRFRDCLLGLYNGRGVVGRGRDAYGWFAEWKRRSYNWTLGWYRGDGEPVDFPLDPTKIQPSLNEAAHFMTSILPKWPPPITDAQRRAIVRAPLTVEQRDDVSTLRTRVLNILNDTAPPAVMAELRANRQALVDAAATPGASDTTAPAPAAEPVSPTVNTGAQVPSIEDLDAFVGDSTMPLGKATGNYFEYIDDYQKAVDDGVTVPSAALTTLGTAVVVAKSVALVVIRELPQIVQPVHTIVPEFQVPADATAPDNYWRPMAGAYGWQEALIAAAGLAVYAVIEGGALIAIEKYMEAASFATFVAGLLGEGALADTAVWVSSAAGSIFGTLAPLLSFWPAAALAGLFGVGGYLAASAFNDITEQLVLEGRSVMAVGTFSYRLTASVLEWNRARKKNRAERDSIYDRATYKARGVPVSSSLTFARVAMKRLTQKTQKEEQDDRSLLTLNVLYDTDVKQRFQYVEYYGAQTVPSNGDLAKLSPVYNDKHWDTVPDTTGLLLLPPPDVVETLFEAEVLRKVPMDKAVQRTVGPAASTTARTPAQLAAKSAHTELLELVKAGRFPYTGTLSGEDLVAGASRVVLELAEEGADLLIAAYGTKAGVTLVYGNDPAWTCLPAGVAARIAVRHAGVFIRADAKRRAATDSVGRFASAISEWKRPQRAIIEQFAKAWVQVARAAAKEKAQLPPDLAVLSSEAVLSFARVGAIMTPADYVAQFVVVSAFSSWLLIAAENSRSAAIIQSALTKAESIKDKFSDQPMRHLNRTTPRDAMGASARWASRRLDWQVVRSWSLTRESSKDSGVEALVKSLASLDVGDNTERFYYCPLGSRLNALPGAVPFAVTALGNHLIWLEVLAVETDRVIRAMRFMSSVEKPTGTHVYAREVVPFTEEPDGPTGLARHPLAISTQKDAVTISVARAAENTPPPAVAFTSSTVLEAFRRLIGSPDVAEEVQARMTRMRITAFNADRYLNALDLAAAQTALDTPVIVELPPKSTASNAMSLALALAMHKAEGRGLQNDMHILVTNKAPLQAVDDAKLLLADVQARCLAAVKKGCRAVSLAEACASMG